MVFVFSSGCPSSNKQVLRFRLRASRRFCAVRRAARGGCAALWAVELLLTLTLKGTECNLSLASAPMGECRVRADSVRMLVWPQIPSSEPTPGPCKHQGRSFVAEQPGAARVGEINAISYIKRRVRVNSKAETTPRLVAGRRLAQRCLNSPVACKPSGVEMHKWAVSGWSRLLPQDCSRTDSC